MKRIIYLLLLALLIISCKKEMHPVEVGQTVPDFSFDRVIDEEVTTLKLKDLKGKTVILEYWSTWCRPCIPALQKLDSLKSIFGENLEVIAISPQEEERILKFKKRTDYDITYVSDTLSQKLFPFRIIPHTVVIGPEGKVRAITDPGEIDAEVIRSVMKGEEIALSRKNDFYHDPNRDTQILKEELDPGYTMTLQSYKEQQRSGYRYHKDQERVNGVSLWNTGIFKMYQVLFHIPSVHRIIFEEGISFDDFPYEPDHLYNLEISTSAEYRDHWEEMGANFLNAYFEYNGKIVKDTLPAYELVVTQDILTPSEKKESTFTFTGPKFEGEAIPINSLVEYLENFTGKPVVDRTGLNGTYDIKFEWGFDDPASLNNAIRGYGLTLQANEAVPMDVLKIYRKKKL